MDRHEFPFPSAELMEGLGDQFFAGPAFAFDQHRGFGRSHLPDGVDDPGDPFGGSHNGADTELIVQPFFQFPVFLFDLLRFERFLHNQFQPVEVHRLGHKVKRPFPHGIHGSFDRAVRGEHDTRRRILFCKGFFQDLEAVGAGHADVCQDKIVVVPFQQVQAGFAILGKGHIVVQTHELGKDFPGPPFIVHQQDGGLGIFLGQCHIQISPGAGRTLILRSRLGRLIVKVAPV